MEKPLVPFIGERTPRLLIVDDEPVNLKVLAAHLTRWGCEVRAAQSGPDALAATGSFQPDLILLDILMPGQSGIEVCEVLQRDPATRHIPVIFLTALTTPESKIQGLDAGARDYVTKPFMVPELAARVGAALRSKFEEDALRTRRTSLSRQVTTDPLTGLTNGPGFERESQRVLAERRGQGPMSLLIADLDEFGRYNAEAGHAQGDEALRRVGELFKIQARSGDLAARYDKDAFVLLMPSTPQAVGSGLAESLRRRLEQPGLTVSIGGTTIGQSGAEEPQVLLERLLNEAHAALESAKAAGGNRVAWV